MADHVGASAAVLMPLYELIRSHVLVAERLHGDDTTVPVLAKSKTVTGRLWVYVRDDRPFGQGKAARRRRSSAIPAIAAASILSFTSPAMPGSCRPMPTAASPGSIGRRAGGAVTEAPAGRMVDGDLHELADLAQTGRAPPAPLAVAAVRQIDAIFAHERQINGGSAEARLAYRREHIAPLVAALESWMRAERQKLSRHADVAKRSIIC